VEMLVKLLGVGFQEYIKDTMNLFDAFIVTASIVELVMGGGGVLSVLRTFRLMRIFKIVRFLPGLQRQMIVIIASVGQMGNFCLILLLYMFIYGILGMYLFGAQLEGRSNFNNLYRSMITVFQMLTIEDWPGVMFDAVSATSFVASVYFMSLIVGGNFVLCNLFVAILLEGFAERAAKDEKSIRAAFENDRLKKFKTRLKKAFTAGSMKFLFEHWKKYTIQSQKYGGGAAFDEYLNNNDPSYDVATPMLAPKDAPADNVAVREGPTLDALELKPEDTEGDPSNSSHLSIPGPDMGNAPPSAMVAPVNEDEELDEEEDEEEIVENKENTDAFTHGNSLFCLSGTNPIRLGAAGIVASTQFDRTILFFIVLNSLVMAIERPGIQDGSAERLFMDIMGFIFTGVFIIEATVKILAWGLLFGPHAYMHDAWNKLDAFLVTVSIVDLTFLIIKLDAGSVIGILRILRLLRALRPLRVINRAPKLKRVVQTLVDSLGSIGNTIMISSVVFLIFGILSVQLFSGKLYYCSEEEGTYNNQTISVATKVDCLNIGGAWENQPYNFDNLLSALLTLFYVSSFDGWVDVMFYTIDATGIDVQPVEDNSELVAMFFIAFLLCANFFILNMFVGVIVESFQMASDPDEAKRVQLQKLRQKKKLQRQQDRYDYVLKVYRLGFGRFERSLVDLVQGQEFDSFITLVIVCNVLCMCVEFEGQPLQMTEVLVYLNYVFSALFAMEAILKIKVFGLTCYFSDAWNKFDSFIVVTSFVGIFIEEVWGGESGLNPAFIRVMRVFRIARILKLVKSAKGLAALLETTIKSLSQVASVCLLLVLIFFIYAAAGVALFGRLSCTEDNECSGLSIHANFENFGIAMLTLFRVSTGDNGNGILKDAMRTPPYCNEDPDCTHNCCSDPYIAIGFFTSFTVVASFVLLNVVIAVLMSELEDSQLEQEAEAEAERIQAERLAEKELVENLAAEALAARQELMKGAGRPSTAGTD